MCIKIAEDELGTVKALMTMSLNAIIADVFDLDLDDIKAELCLREDLNMSAGQQQQLVDVIGEYFDDISVNLDEIKTLGELFERVVFSEFK